MSKNYMSKNEDLRRGDSLVSNNGEFKAVFQEDGNFVVYGWKSVWASNTNGTGAFRLVMQNDSNLVIYDKGSKALWDTKSWARNTEVCRLQLTDKGKLEVTRDAVVVWTS